MWLIASSHCIDVTSTATDIAMPAVVMNDRAGQRMTWRSRMRVGWSRRRTQPSSLSAVRRNSGGAGGRMASAGGSAAAARTAASAPISAAPMLTAPAITNACGPGRNSRNGK